jgi:hypothetical protein
VSSGRSRAELAWKPTRAVALLCAILLSACVRAPSISAAEAEAVQAAAERLLTSTAETPTTSGPLPPAIDALEPKSVRIAPEGVYVETSSWFVEEAGIFVPRDPASFAPGSGSDAEYHRIHGNVFSYRIRG